MQVFGSIQYFDTAVIEKFGRDYITSEEAAKLLEVTKLTIQKWARTGSLTNICVSGPHVDGGHTYLFDHKRLIQWRDQSFHSCKKGNKYLEQTD